MNVNEYLKKHRKALVFKDHMHLELCPHIECADGLILSVQASSTHYATPRINHGPYTHVEVGYPSEPVEELMPYAEDGDCPTQTVYGYVPVEVVEQVIESHGGIANG
jgi:hypothetical protein